MKKPLQAFVFGAVFALFLASGWVSYSDDTVKPAGNPAGPAAAGPCPGMTNDEEKAIIAPPEEPHQMTQQEFMAAHGIKMENYSAWMKERTEWRQKNADALKQFSFIPKAPPKPKFQDITTGPLAPVTLGRPAGSQ